MVALQPSSAWGAPDDDADTALPAKYREACDEDIRSTNNTMVSSQYPQLEFYVIPAQWLKTVLPFLLGKSTVRPEAKINNCNLLAPEHAVSSDSDNDGSPNTDTDSMRRKRKQRWHEKELRHVQQAHQDFSLKDGLSFEKDYFLIGPNVWCMVSYKFGYDYALPRKVVPMAMSESRLGVQVYPAPCSPVPVPPSGRFSYEEVSARKSIAEAPPVVADDTDVSDSEQQTDLFPGYDAGDSTMEDSEMTNFAGTAASSSTEPVLMLPPSTTALNNDDTMEFEQGSTPQRRKRYAAGLANLGNTCFMNSTLQCLAHTDPLRRYFVSKEFLQDLNKDNPLGTGGELATEFSSLLDDIWVKEKRSSSFYGSDVAYPRSFKTALGRHAMQFVGYDQHDSQEFATYLLDALHEDTNRITKKPYIEKPEQKEGETDDEAADIAWKLHLQREDSRVLENFMGQVKSRVQCPTAGCGRVSTTFDPFMYLSVPIPGATDVTIPVTLVSSNDENCTFRITLNKMATIEVLQKKVAEKWKEKSGVDIAMENMVAVDVWSNKLWAYHEPNECVDKIAERDVTNIYELKSVDDVMKDDVDVGDNTLAVGALEPKRTYRRHNLDILTLNKLNRGDNWIDALGEYMSHPLGLTKNINAKRSSHEERVEFYQKLEAFIELCHASSDGHNSEQDGSDDAEMTVTDENPQEESKYDSLPSLEERCHSSRMFRNVKEVKDLAILEFCSQKFRKRCLDLLEEGTTKYDKEGLLIEVRMRSQNSMLSTSSSDFSVPLCIRVPPKMTVYGLREELALRLSTDLKTDYLSRKPLPPPPPSDNLDTKIAASNVTPEESNGSSDQSDDVPMETTSNEKPNDGRTNQDMLPRSSFDLGSPELLIMRQIPLTYNRRSSTGGANNQGIAYQLGMLELSGIGSHDGHPMTLANRDDEAEQHTIAEVVGHKGTVHLNWSRDLCSRTFDAEKYERADTVEDPEEASRKAAEETITVKSCIDKHCHMEQLDETEMWYCNRCKDHVRAWKQFHLYRSPPILIVHLKRFHYSSSTHRRNKIDTFVDFPLTGLDLTNEFTHWTEDEKPVYDCYAVSNHFGGLGGGHYTAYALSDEGTWSNFDDSRVTTDVDPKDVVSNAAYVLYYRRQDVKLDGPEVEVVNPLPAIVDDSYFQPQEESNARIDDMDNFHSLDAEMNGDNHSTTSSNKSVMDSVEIDPYDQPSNFADEMEQYKNNLPLQ